MKLGRKLAKYVLLDRDGWLYLGRNKDGNVDDLVQCSMRRIKFLKGLVANANRGLKNRRSK